MKFIPGWLICHIICKNSKKDGGDIFFLKIILVFPCKFTLYTRGGCVHKLRTLRLSHWAAVYLDSSSSIPTCGPEFGGASCHRHACHCHSLAKCFVKDTIFERATTWLANLKMLITFDTFLGVWQIWWQIDQHGINFIMIWSDLTGTFLTVRMSQCSVVFFLSSIILQMLRHKATISQWYNTV